MKEIEGVLKLSPQIREYDIIKDGSYRIALKSTYPNGENIDLFLRKAHTGWMLSDGGGISAYLNQIDRKALPVVINYFAEASNIEVLDDFYAMRLWRIKSKEFNDRLIMFAAFAHVLTIESSLTT